ncbi:PorT family protein [Belliella sp. DSM 111904]|uniref:PorT family protein n=1 Tax=Belliella filtrata TaxID=2923435 RepID=A0ABS9V578_9BACT|nr:outer membrane beta-barrel protein [Belliella filtrata]MCH7411562.1 PorT family protein [Belliella filtrata]
MKKLLFIMALSLIIPTLGFAQEEEFEQQNVVKTKDFKLFGSDWHYEKYENKHWSLTTNGEDVHLKGRKKRRYERSLNFDLGINTWVENDPTPQVKPWGSWTVGINYQRQYKFGNNFSLNPGLGVNWYNFKFEDRNLIAVREADGIGFEQFTGNGVGTKSKITSSYVNLSLIPTIHSNNGKFRFGVGPYAGFRLGGRGKFVYDDIDGNKNKIFDRANMFANNVRYGARANLGIGGTDFFISYDLNDYFIKDKGPRANAISFGITL